MSSNLRGLIELLLIVVIVFGFGLYQLHSLRRDKQGRKPPRRDSSDREGDA